jgi:ribonuclease D
LELIRVDEKQIPERLVSLLENPRIMKIFHHAMFDLRFLHYRWRLIPANTACTKIASKLLTPERPEGHSLASLTQQYLGVTLNKTWRTSDWLSSNLAPAQLEYAGNDVVYLSSLLQSLMSTLKGRGLDDLARRCFAHIPAQVQLDVRGYKDVFGY